MKKFLYSLLFCVYTVSFSGEKVASYYSGSFNGKTTASGYIYNDKDMTCASMDYPFGTVLRVTNLRNKNSVDVVVTDRGNFKKKYGRDIDLSKSSFQKLDKICYGLLKVRVEVIDSKHIFKYKKGNKKFNKDIYIKDEKEKNNDK